MSDEEDAGDKGEGDSREGLAEDRTHFAEDRTVLANERTFASWFRTGFASMAIGLGFQALFLKMNPPWVPKSIATLFLMLAIFLFVSAERRACAVLARLSTHSVKEFSNNRLRIMMVAASIGALALAAAIWLLPLIPETAQPPETAQRVGNAIE